MCCSLCNVDALSFCGRPPFSGPPPHITAAPPPPRVDYYLVSTSRSWNTCRNTSLHTRDDGITGGRAWDTHGCVSGHPNEIARSNPPIVRPTSFPAVIDAVQPDTTISIGRRRFDFDRGIARVILEELRRRRGNGTAAMSHRGTTSERVRRTHRSQEHIAKARRVVLYHHSIVVRRARPGGEVRDVRRRYAIGYVWQALFAFTTRRRRRRYY